MVLKEAVTYFEYGKSEKKYQIREYLLDQIIKKPLFIKKISYLDYALLFSFNNAISYLIYT